MSVGSRESVRSKCYLVLSALFGILCFPPISFWPLAYVAMVPFLFGATSLLPRTALKWGYVSGFLFFSGLLYWIGFNSGAPPAMAWLSCVAVVAILATIWSVAAWSVSKVSHSAGVAWAATTFVFLYLFFEVFWGTGELGFPWAIWALSQTACLPVIQIAELGDVWLISLYVLGLNALVFLYLKGIARVVVLPLAVVLMLSVPMYGAYRLATFQRGELFPVAAIQANTPVEDKWELTPEETLAQYVNLTESIADSQVALVVWPETATPIPLRYRDWARMRIQRLSDSIDLSIVTGATDYESVSGGEMIPYNSAFVFRPHEGELWSAAKVHLVPFGERVPFQKYLPILGAIRLGQAEFAPGAAAKVLPKSDLLPSLGCLICFEVVFPEVAADMVKNGASLFANLTEDGWYGRSSEQSQHLELTRLRAVASRRSIIRAANLGYPALFLPTGEISASLDLDQTGAVCSFVTLQSDITLAAKMARLWLPLYSALLATLLLTIWIRTRLHRTA